MKVSHENHRPHGIVYGTTYTYRPFMYAADVAVIYTLPPRYVKKDLYNDGNSTGMEYVLPKKSACVNALRFYIVCYV